MFAAERNEQLLFEVFYLLYYQPEKMKVKFSNLISEIFLFNSFLPLLHLLDYKIFRSYATAMK